VKHSEHSCAVPGCEGVAPREYPLCKSCWYGVPTELRKAVRAELAKAERDEGALYDAVSRAAASVEGLGEEESAVVTEAVWNWELAYLKAGKPKLEEKSGR
jgi:hypothetical protein